MLKGSDRFTRDRRWGLEKIKKRVRNTLTEREESRQMEGRESFREMAFGVLADMIK